LGDENSSYAGRWVARLRGRIVAQGGTPDQARRAAQSRFKEVPEIIFMAYPFTLPPILDSVKAALPTGLKVYLVGGAVRDILLQRNTHDLDFTLEQDAIKLARKLANALNADFYPLDTGRDTGRVLVMGEAGSRTFLDFAAFRGADLETDLSGRDFTVNAMALDLNDDSLHDPLGGAMDLREKKLRACSASAMMDDPVRILRGVRLAAGFGFHIQPDTREKMKEAAPSLERISPERLRDELFRILDGPRRAGCLRSLDRLGALEKVLPELSGLKGAVQRPPHVYDVWEHTLAVVNHLESILGALEPAYNPDSAADWHNGLLVLQLGRYRQSLGEHLSTELIPGRALKSLLFLAAIYHDVAKPAAKTVDETGQLRFWGHDQLGAEVAVARGRALVLSNDELKRLETIINGHMRIHFFTNQLIEEGKMPTRRAVYRFFRQNGAAGVDICLLTLADLRATYEQTLPRETWTACLEVVRLMLEAWFERQEEAISPASLLDGNDLLRELSLKPGPLVGKLIESVREAQAAGEISTREEALALARKKLEEEE
jgi:tRNA nucleotidyltransferase/poly(A) polymerase